jgi:peroxiredoxin
VRAHAPWRPGAWALVLWAGGALLLGCSDAARVGAPGGEGAAGVQAEGEGDREMAPDFTLSTLQGESVTLSELRGKTVVIDFWATWCPPCEFQVPELNAFYEANLGRGDVQVLGVSVDAEGPDVVGEWVEEKGVRYPILLGSEDLARRYGAMGFPTLVVIAPDGTVDSRHVGLIETADLEEIMAERRGARG